MYAIRSYYGYYFKLGQRWVGSDFLSNYKRPYILRWKLSEPSPGEEVEPNDRRHEANEIPIGQVFSGYLSSKSDYDLFRIPHGTSHLRIDFSRITSYNVCYTKLLR